MTASLGVTGQTKCQGSQLAFLTKTPSPEDRGSHRHRPADVLLADGQVNDRSDRELCQEKYNEIRDMRSRGLPTIPTTIGEERAYNLFMRCNDPKTQKLVGADGSPVETMEVLRKLKNEFR